MQDRSGYRDVEPLLRPTGGVLLDLRNPADIERAFSAVQERVAARSTAPVPVMVQKMIHGVLELYVGARSDPEFGLLVLFGLGGIFVEVSGRIATRLAPVSEAEAEAMIVESGVNRALRRLGVANERGRTSLVDAIVRMSQLVAQSPTSTRLRSTRSFYKSTTPVVLR